jgi:hypothetical protein
MIIYELSITGRNMKTSFHKCRSENSRSGGPIVEVATFHFYYSRRSPQVSLQPHPRSHVTVKV